MLEKPLHFIKIRSKIKKAYNFVISIQTIIRQKLRQLQFLPQNEIQRFSRDSTGDRIYSRFLFATGQ